MKFERKELENPGGSRKFVCRITPPLMIALETQFQQLRRRLNE